MNVDDVKSKQKQICLNFCFSFFPPTGTFYVLCWIGYQASSFAQWRRTRKSSELSSIDQSPVDVNGVMPRCVKELVVMSCPKWICSGDANLQREETFQRPFGRQARPLSTKERCVHRSVETGNSMLQG
jgi:hypothetical protein